MLSGAHQTYSKISLILDSFPMLIHIMALVMTLWYPIIHLIRYWLTPDGMFYTGVESTDVALFVWTMNSPYIDFFSLRDLEQDVNIFLRPDYMPFLLIPFAIFTSFLGLSGVVGYTLVLCFWNGLCVYVLYYFYDSFFRDKRISIAAVVLSYILSGASGFFALLNWIFSGIASGEFPSSLDLHNWIGENHKISNEFADGNAIISLTNASRAHYLAPRVLGLLSIAFFHRSVLDISAKNVNLRLATTAILMFFCTMFHPASGLVYASMFAILVAFYAIQENEIMKSRTYRLLWYPFFGFLLATIFWQIYRNIPEVKSFVQTYITSLHNTDSLPLFLATFPTASVVLFYVLKRINYSASLLFFIASAISWLLGLSEFFIRDYSVLLRACLLIGAIFFGILFLFSARSKILAELRSEKTKYGYLMLIWAIAAVLISASPHHDVRTVIYMQQTETDFVNFLKKASDLGNMVYAARFKLGIWVPLIGAFAFFSYQYSEKIRNMIFISVFFITLPSSIIYIYHTCRAGYISNEEREAYLFLKSQSGRNVMCAPITGVFLPNIALKRTFGTPAGDANWKAHEQDTEEFFCSRSNSVRKSILDKYRIDFIFFGKNENLYGNSDFYMTNCEKIFQEGEFKIFKVMR